MNPFSKIFNLGIKTSMQPLEKKSIGFINRYNTIFIIVLLIQSVSGLIGGKYFVVLVGVVSIFLNLLTLFLNYKEKYDISKHLFLIFGFAVNFSASLVFSKDTGSLIYYIIPVILPVLVLRKNYQIYIYYFFTVLSFLSTVYYYQNFEPIMPEQTQEELIWVYYSNMFIVIFVLGFSIIKFFSNLNIEYENVLISKNKLLKEQKEEIETINDKLKKTNEELITTLTLVSEQKAEIEHDHREIQASINYALRIQEALLPPKELIASLNKEFFIINIPRDVVSGDFYWFRQYKNHLYICAADCTGHGVPGAFMSMLGVSLLNEIITEFEVTYPNLILSELRKRLKQSLHQNDEKSSTKDGMDIALCLLNTENLNLQYSGAYHALFIYRKNNIENKYELIEYKANKMPIGVHPRDMEDFTNHSIQLSKDDAIYVFSDGFDSQFGGEKNEKFKVRRFKESLLNIQHLNMNEQKTELLNILAKWQGNHEQVDDILVIGLKIT